jgi:hypothetical protein
VGAAGASENPTRLWEPSQNGLFPELPQRHSFTTGALDPSLRGGIGRSLPSGPTTRTGPSTTSGPFDLGVIMTSVMGRNIRDSLIALAVLVAPRTVAAQATVGPEAGVLTGFGDHTTQVALRLTELSPRWGADVMFATFPEAFGNGGVPLAFDLDATLPVPVFPGLFIAPRAGVGLVGSVGSSSGTGAFSFNLGVGVIGRVAGPVALRADVTEHRFIEDLSLSFRSYTMGVTWLLR